MQAEQWHRLKSGSDIRGAAMETDACPIELTDEAVERLGRAFACFVAKKCGKPCEALTLSVGRDSRLSGPRMRDALVKGLRRLGVTVLDCGLASTPAMFMTTVDLACDGAVQITASHHPWHRNGLKFFLPEGGLEGHDISEIITMAQQDVGTDTDNGTVREVLYMDTYAARLRRMICEGLDTTEDAKPLSGFHIVVDAGNGVGGFYADAVLAPLGADVSGSQFLDPDGRFPNHIPNPEDKTAMESICGAVLANKADLGVIFDTDVDRAGCVDATGAELNRNRLVALAAAIALEDAPGGTIVTDSVTSDGLKIFIEQTLGGRHHRFKRGYRNVIDEAIRLNNEGINAPLAIETSGHAALRNNYFLDDGAYLITRIIITAAKLRRQGKTLDSVIAALPMPAESRELRFSIEESEFAPYGNGVLARLEAFAAENGWYVAPDSYEGVRISFPANEGDGFALLRLSVHDPVMPLNIESNVNGGCRVIAQKLLPFFAQQGSLGITALTDFIA